MSTDSTSNEPTTPSERTFTSKDLYELQKAMDEVSDFEKFLIRRARVFSALYYKTNRKLPSPDTFETGNGFYVGLHKWHLKEAVLPTTETVKFYYHDSRDGGPYHEFEVPRDFIFGDDTSENDYQKYLELKERFEG